MKWHAGTLSILPQRNRTWQLANHGNWWGKTFPKDLFEELEILFATPGLDKPWLRRNLARTDVTISKALKKFRPYEEIKDKVMENWYSITREDAVLMSRRRQPWTAPPLVSQLSMIDDIKQGRPIVKTAAEYGVWTKTLQTILKEGVQNTKTRWFVPPEFAMLFGVTDNPKGYTARPPWLAKAEAS